MNAMPRRNQVLKWSAAEHAIYAAVQAVEALGADVRLTEAVVLLQEAREKVADYIEGVPPGRKHWEMGSIIVSDTDQK